MLRRVLFLCAVFSFVPVLAAPDKSGPNSTEKDLQGAWQAVEGEANGQKVADDQVQELQIVIEANRLEIKPEGEGRRTTFTVDSGKSPGTIDLIPLDGTRKGSIVPGIYALQDGHLKLCINIWGKIPSQRPTEFKARSDDGCVFLTLKRTAQK